MITATTEGFALSGDMTFLQAKLWLAKGKESFASHKGNLVSLDLSAMCKLDSSALAIIFGWMRALQKEGKTLALKSPPQDLLSLGQMYGISDILPIGS